MSYSGCMNYLRAHWRGEQPLVLSFWVNLVAARVVLWTVPFHALSPAPLPFPILPILIAADFALFLWQIVGVVRSAENHMLLRGGMAPTWGIYAAIAVVVFAMVTQWLGLYQMTLDKPDEELFTDRMDRLHASQYDLRVADDGKALLLDGTIALGITKATAALLAQQPQIERIELASTGGNIFEARGMAALILPLQLRTHVETECSSACTLVFMAGEERSLGQQARLGFHAYRLDSDIQMPHIDIVSEQERDRSFFLARNLDADFLERIFERENAEIWFPDHRELQDAGVIRMPGSRQ